MNKNILLLITLFCTTIAAAQTDSFGIVDYAVPSGYELIKHDNVLTWYTENKATGAYCNFFIYAVGPGQGNVQNDFDNAWANQVQKPFKITGAASSQPVATIKGWQFLLGNTRYEDKGAATLAMLITFSRNNRTQSICILSNSDKYKADIEAFIASVDISSAAGPATNSKNIKYEVWECHCMNISTSNLELKTVVLSPDSRCLYYMPETGLNGVTPDNPSWGSVTDKSTKLQLRNEQYGNMELYKITPISMSRYPNSKTTIYKKVRPVDGLRIEGAYSPERTPDKNATNRPIITFKKDGTYSNEGLAFSNITRNDNFAIGRGTYEIVNYSLILTTRSGRKLQIAFTPILDANPESADNPGLIINNILYYRLNQ